jgi:predicted membrane protein (TIGR00267 family)
MHPLAQFHLALRVSRSHGILRRYFVVNGFDGALTMLGLITGFHLSADVELGIVIRACLGAAVALGISGLTSAYLSESAERRRWLAELEEAMARDLSASAHGTAARLVPVLIALVNGLAPFLLALIIVLPLALAAWGLALPVRPLVAAICTAFLCIFGLGAFLGRVGGTSWLVSGIKTLSIALITVLLIRLFEA